MLLELGKAVSFLLSLLSLYPLLFSAFFVPGTAWQDRLLMSLDKAAIAACICVGSGLLFSLPSSTDQEANPSLISTLPVRVFLWALLGMVVLFIGSWYFETYYVPLLWRNLP